MGFFDSIIDFLKSIWNSFALLVFSSDNLIFDLIDILVVTFLVYKIIQFMRQTRAEQLIKGIIIFFLVYFAAQLLHLNALKWVVSIVTANILVVVVILFQPELRSILEKLGRSGISSFSITKSDEENDFTEKMIENVCTAAQSMQKTKTGALIIIERKTMLSEIAVTGTLVDAEVSVNLINNIFFKNSPLHDGAMIIRNNRIYAASCILPLTQNNDIDSELGTRHRAAIGVSEISDAVVVVVSEETGNISVALGGKLRRNFTKELLKTELSSLLIKEKDSDNESRIRKLFKKKGGSNNEKV
ncbi:MAG: diadenylate cyclase CdaA [Acutalibacteraceae bacterium]